MLTKDKLEELANESTYSDQTDPDMSIVQWCGDTPNEIYWIGNLDGRIELAREILAYLERNI